MNSLRDAVVLCVLTTVGVLLARQAPAQDVIEPDRPDITKKEPATLNPLPASRSKSHQFAERTEIQVQFLRRQPELRSDLADRLLELHQRRTDGFGFLARQRLLLHAPDRLAFHQPTQEFDDGEDELHDRFLHVFGLGIPARRPRARFELLAKRTKVRRRDGRSRNRSRSRRRRACVALPPRGLLRAFLHRR